MTHDEKAFFKALGARIAELRKESDITQVQLAEAMNCVFRPRRPLISRHAGPAISRMAVQ